MHAEKVFPEVVQSWHQIASFLHSLIASFAAYDSAFDG